jgi:hypothetical protein
MSDFKAHTHRYYVNGMKIYYDNEKGCMVKNVLFKCTCGRKYHELYEYRPPPQKGKQPKALEKHKRLHSNQE